MKILKCLSSDSSKNSVELRKLQNLQEKLDTFDYGTIIDGVRYDETKLDDIDWSYYRTLPLDRLEKEKIGVCWDFVNYQHDFFKKNEIKDQSYIFVMDRTKYDSGVEDVVTHTFSILDVDNVKYWFENSFYKYRGIWRIKDVYDVIQVLRNHYDPKHEFEFSVYPYDADNLDENLSDEEFFETVTVSDPLNI